MTEGKAEYKEHKKQPTASRHVGASMLVPRSPSDKCANIVGTGVGQNVVTQAEAQYKTSRLLGFEINDYALF